MTNQEFEKQMNLMAQQQVRFAADLERRRARDEEFELSHKAWKVEIEDVLGRLAKVTSEGFKDVNAKINALIDAQIRTEDAQRTTDEQIRLNAEEQRKTDEQIRLVSEEQRKTDDLIRLVSEEQRKTDEHLRRTIDLFNRYFGQKHNGRDKR